jgi:rhodanese-related sulfurtransferase
MSSFTTNRPSAPTPAVLPTAESKTYLEASPRQVHDWLRADQAVIIDVREPDEHARERIPGSRLVPLSGFDPTQAAAQAKPGQRIVMQCRSGRRSADAARMASGLSVSGCTVVNMTGGIEAWKKENLPVEVDTKVSSISIMRQVQMIIGTFVLAGSALAWFVDPLFIGVPAFFGAGLLFAGATGICALASLVSKLSWNRAASRTNGCGKTACGG